MPGAITIGTLAGINERGQPLVDFPDNTAGHSLVAISSLRLSQRHTGRQVTLLFANGNSHQPVIMELIHDPLQEMLERFDPPQTDNNPEIKAELNVEAVRIDGNKLVFEAKEEIVFQCGQASIVLNKEGKISLRGTKISTRSTGVNRIMGASVQLN
ncbi:hypothetical protein MNBD_GAMMA17-1051 [hydrothermal vent metagenome]|uniref:DUF6484 domain-containing protein n=1 Tax=hydrothermal vent metagenome TaxID=652676 RepID=A0A3B0ZGW3_9ZZZZ